MGGARSVIYLVPEESRAIAIMCNAQWSSLIESTAKVLLDVWTGSSAKRRDPENADQHQRWRYAGTFGDAAVSGDLEIGPRGGSMSVPDAVNERLRQAKIERFPLRVVANSRLALVSPIGLLEASLDEGASGEGDQKLVFDWGSRSVRGHARAGCRHWRPGEARLRPERNRASLATSLPHPRPIFAP